MDAIRRISLVKIYQRGLLLGWCLVAAGTPVMAQSIYKSVDANGKVTYSTEPLANAASAAVITPSRGPTEADRQAAEARAAELERAMGEVDQQREQRLEASRKKPDPSGPAADGGKVPGAPPRKETGAGQPRPAAAGHPRTAPRSPGNRPARCPRWLHQAVQRPRVH